MMVSKRNPPIPGYHFQLACWTLEGYHPDLFDIHKVKSTVVHGGSNGNEVINVIFEADNWVLCQQNDHQQMMKQKEDQMHVAAHETGKSGFFGHIKSS